MKTHQERFSEARFAARDADNDADRVKHLTAAIDELGYVLIDLNNVAYNAHHRLEAEQVRIKRLENDSHNHKPPA